MTQATYSRSSNRQPHSISERGQVLVETALVLPIGILLLFGCLQLGVAYMKYQQVGFAASEGARCASVARSSPTPNPSCAQAALDPSDAARIAAKRRSGGLNLVDSDIVVTSSSSFAYPGTVTVTVTQQQSVPILNNLTYTLRASRTERLER